MAVNINIPSQVKTFANLAAFPASGAVKTIYIAEDTNKTYRWTGSVYVEISASAAMTWGQIGGTLFNQTDLQTALNAKQDSLGFTAVPTTRTLTINGTTQDLSANRTFTIPTDLTVGTTPIASGTIGRVLFQGTGNVLQQSSSLAYDDTTKAFTLSGSIGSGSAVRNSVTNTSNSGFADFFAFNDTGRYLGVQIGGSAATGTFANISNANISKIVTNNPFVIGTQNTNPLIFAVGASVTTGEVARFSASTGNFLINTTTDAGFRLDVNGTARMQGNTTIGTTTTSQTVLNIFSSSRADFRLKTSGSSDNSFSVYAVGGAFGSNYAQFGTNDGENASQQGGAIYTDSRTGGAPPIRLMVKGTGTTAMTSAMSIFNTGNVGINTTTDAGFRLDVNGSARVGTTLTVGSSSQTGIINIARTDGAIMTTISSPDVCIINNAQGSGVRLNTDNVTYFHVRGFASQFAANVTGALTANAGFTRALLINNTINANANNNELAAVYINPTFNNGAFTGVKNIAIQSTTGGAHFNTTSVNDSAILQADSTTKGFLPPRMTTTQRNAIASPAAGLVVYDNTDNKHYGYNGTTWNAFY